MRYRLLYISAVGIKSLRGTKQSHLVFLFTPICGINAKDIIITMQTLYALN
jgi:hypothetical protein